jgi:DNA polymerase III subunit epsilon
VSFHNEKPFREPRPFLATNEEIDAHAEFLKSIKNPLWLAAAE